MTPKQIELNRMRETLRRLIDANEELHQENLRLQREACRLHAVNKDLNFENSRLRRLVEGPQTKVD